MVQNKLFKKITLLIVLLIISSVLLVACTESIPDEPGADAGMYVPVYDDDHNLTGYEMHAYNSDKELSQTIYYDTDKNVLYVKRFEYNDKGLLSQETWYKANGLGDYYYTYSYDDNDNIIEKGYYPQYGTASITKYDSEGNETEHFYYDENDKLEKHEVLKNGEWVEEKVDE